MKLDYSSTCGYSEECEEGHAEWSEVCVFPQSLAGMLLVTFLPVNMRLYNEALKKPTKSSKQFHAKGSKNEEQKKEEEAEIADLGQSLHHSVK